VSKDWLAWHAKYDEPGSRLAQRLDTVQRLLRIALDEQRAGPIRVISLCAGQGRDLLGVLVDHPRRADVTARLVELDERNVANASSAATDHGHERVTVVQGDASLTNSYEGAVPAEIVLACGIFGNVTDADIEATAAELPHLCGPGATVIWTRGGQPERLDRVDGWFRAAGFELLHLETGGGDPPYGVGAHRLVAVPPPFRAGRTMFTFRRDRQGGPA
jgi:hypothetical protein